MELRTILRLSTAQFRTGVDVALNAVPVQSIRLQCGSLLEPILLAARLSSTTILNFSEMYGLLDIIVLAIETLTLFAWITVAHWHAHYFGRLELCRPRGYYNKRLCRRERGMVRYDHTPFSSWFHAPLANRYHTQVS